MFIKQAIHGFILIVGKFIENKLCLLCVIQETEIEEDVIDCVHVQSWLQSPIMASTLFQALDASVSQCFFVHVRDHKNSHTILI